LNVSRVPGNSPRSPFRSSAGPEPAFAKPGTRAKFLRDSTATDVAGALCDATDADAFAGLLARLTGENPSSPGFEAALATLERRDVPAGAAVFPEWTVEEARRLATLPSVRSVIVAGAAGVIARTADAEVPADDPRIASAVRLAAVVVPATKSLGLGAHLESVVRGEEAEIACIGTYGHVIVATFDKGPTSRRVLDAVRDTASALGRAFMKSALEPETSHG
jgi:hypothetical protein